MLNDPSKMVHCSTHDITLLKHEMMEKALMDKGYSQDAGHMIVDVESEEIKDYFLPTGYEWCKNHISYARQMLITLSQDEDIPKEKIVMWY